MTEKDRCDYVFRVQNVCDDIPGVGHLLSSFVPTPGNLPPKTKKVLMPGGYPGGGWARLELTDALQSNLSTTATFGPNFLAVVKRIRSEVGTGKHGR